MSHPETYYDAKRALAAVRDGYRGMSHFGSDLAAQVLTALGWEPPAPAMNGKRKVKVYACDARIMVPTDVAAKVEAGIAQRPGSQRRLGVMAYVVADSKKAAAEHLSPAWMGSRRTDGIVEVDPTDYRYALARDYPEFVVTTVGNDEFGEVVLVPVEKMGTR